MIHLPARELPSQAEATGPIDRQLGAIGPRETLTVSLGTGLSCLADHPVTRQAESEVARGYPPVTGRSRLVISTMQIVSIESGWCTS